MIAIKSYYQKKYDALHVEIAEEEIKTIREEKLYNWLWDHYVTIESFIPASRRFYEFIPTVTSTYADKVDEIFRKHKIYRKTDTVTLYGEFYGKNSFGGFHNWEEDQDLYFFDAFLYKRNFLTPSEFYSEFQNISMPRFIYKGLFEKQLIRNVEQNKYNLREGVVYKFVKNGRIYPGKIKTLDWLKKVKEN
jgi:hypothetical protein